MIVPSTKKAIKIPRSITKMQMKRYIYFHGCPNPILQRNTRCLSNKMMERDDFGEVSPIKPQLKRQGIFSSAPILKKVKLVCPMVGCHKEVLSLDSQQGQYQCHLCGYISTVINRRKFANTQFVPVRLKSLIRK
jgi:hypothetical protein